jgi:hypothetical protein
MADQKKETISLEKFKKLCTDLFKQRVKADEMQALADAERLFSMTSNLRF